MASRAFSLSSEDLWKIGKGALIAIGGALLTWAADSLLPDLQNRGLIDAAMFVFFSTLINAVRKWWTDATSVVVLLLVGLSCLSASASATELIDIGEPGDGKHRYEVVVRDGKIVSVLPLEVVRVGQKPTTPPPDVPPPTNPTAFTLQVRDLTKAALDSGGSKTTGAALSSVYSLVADGVAKPDGESGSISTDRVWGALKQGSDLIIASQADGAKWGALRTELGKLLTTASGNNELVTKAQIAAKLKEVSAGMNMATGFRSDPHSLAKFIDPKKAGILDGIDLAKLVELIKLVMELIKLFSGGI
jgi:hypothetical protein